MNQLSPFFIEQGIPAITVRFLRICGHRIQLQPHMAEQCRQPTKSDAVPPESCKRQRRWPTGAPHHLRRKSNSCHVVWCSAPGHHYCQMPRTGVCVSGLRSQYAPTGSTGLKLNMWKTFTEEIKQSIELTGRASAAARPSCPACTSSRFMSHFT